MGTQAHWGDCKSADSDSVVLVGLNSIFLTSSFLTSDATVSDSLTTIVNSREIIRKGKNSYLTELKVFYGFYTFNRIVSTAATIICEYLL